MTIWFASCNPEGDLEIWSNEGLGRPEWKPRIGDPVHNDPEDRQRVFLIYDDCEVPLGSFLEAAKLLRTESVTHLFAAYTAEAYHKALTKA